MNNNTYLMNFTEFGKIQDIYKNVQDKSGLIEFVNNVVMNMDIYDKNNNNGYGIMLKDLSNIYVLITKPNFPFNKLNSKQSNRIDLKGTKNGVVLGYIWLCPWKVTGENNISCHFINFIDSRISGMNITRYMIQQYEEKSFRKCCLLPYEIMFSAKEYWKKYFIRFLNITNKTVLSKMIDVNHITPNDIKWDNLEL